MTKLTGRFGHSGQVPKRTNRLPNLRAEMRRYGITAAALAETIGRSERCVRNKLSGKGEFSMGEGACIRDTYFPGADLDYLFDMCPQAGPRLDPATTPASPIAPDVSALMNDCATRLARIVTDLDHLHLSARASGGEEGRRGV